MQKFFLVALLFPSGEKKRKVISTVSFAQRPVYMQKLYIRILYPYIYKDPYIQKYRDISKYIFKDSDSEELIRSINTSALLIPITLNKYVLTEFILSSLPLLNF